MAGGRFNPKIFPGARFGMLTVIERIPGVDGQRAKVRCQCDCGQVSTPNADNLSGKRGTRSCGCQKRAAGGRNAKARIVPGVGYGKIVPGKRFGRLTVIARIRNTRYVSCRCRCGKETKTAIDGLVNDAIKSCGCLAKEVTTKRNKDTAKFGCFSSKYPRTWLRWSGMLTRCYRKTSKSFADYGGRGVVVCAFLRQSPWNLKKAIGLSRKANPSLDRYPIHDGNYTCGQCKECRRRGWVLNIRWTTRKGQSENRGDFNVRLTAFGETKLKSQWTAESGLSWSCLTKRLRRGWDVERALATPDKNGRCLER